MEEKNKQDEFINQDFAVFKREDRILSFSERSFSIGKVQVSLNRFEFDETIQRNKEQERTTFYLDIEDMLELAINFQNEIFKDEIRKRVKEGNRDLSIFKSYKGSKGEKLVSKRFTLSIFKGNYCINIQEGKGRLGKNGLIMPDYEKADCEISFFPEQKELNLLFQSFLWAYEDFLCDSYLNGELLNYRSPDKNYKQNSILELASYNSFLRLTSEGLSYKKIGLSIARYNREKNTQEAYALFYLDLEEILEMKEILRSRDYERSCQKLINQKKASGKQYCDPLFSSFKGSERDGGIESRILALNLKDDQSHSISIRSGKGKKTDKGVVLPVGKPLVNVLHNLDRKKLLMMLEMAILHYRANERYQRRSK